MSYSRFVQDPWTQRKRAEFEWAMGPHVAAAGVGQVMVERGRLAPQVRVSREIALPKMQWRTPALRDVEPPPPRPMNWAAVLGWAAVLAVGAGIFWATTNQPKRVATNRRRRRMRRNAMRYELVYSTGGHGGPYQSLDAAKDAAERLLRGGQDQWIAVVPASQITNLRKARPTAVLYRKGGWQKRSWLPNIPAHLRENRRRRRSSRRRVSRNDKSATRDAWMASTPLRFIEKSSFGPVRNRVLEESSHTIEWEKWSDLPKPRVSDRGRDALDRLVRQVEREYGFAPGMVRVEVKRGRERKWIRPNRLTKAKRRRMSRKSFVFPGRRAWPLDSQKRAKAAIAYMHMGRVGTKGDYLAIRNEIIRRYGVGFWRDAGGPSWEKIARAKTKRAWTRRRRTTRRMAANRGRKRPRRVRANTREWWEDQSGESTLSVKTKKPMKVGVDYIRDAEWEPKLFTRAQAERYMERHAKERNAQERRKSPFWHAVVSDAGDYWRGSLGGQPFVHGKPW